MLSHKCLGKARNCEVEGDEPNKGAGRGPMSGEWNAAPCKTVEEIATHAGKIFIVWTVLVVEIYRRKGDRWISMRFGRWLQSTPMGF